METKSRYEVIADFEERKRELILERNELDDKVVSKELNIKNINRETADIDKHVRDFEFKQQNKLKELERNFNNNKDELEREKKEFDFKIENTRDKLEREKEDREKELEHFKTTMERRKDTINEMIKGINESLERFGKLNESKKKE